jgi:hypothetical protein
MHFRSVQPQENVPTILSQHYHAQPHTSLKTTQKAISKLGWTVLLHPPLTQISFPHILTTLEPSKMPFVGKRFGVMRLLKKSEEMAASTKLKIVHEEDRLSPAGTRLLQLMEIA